MDDDSEEPTRRASLRVLYFLIMSVYSLFTTAGKERGRVERVVVLLTLAMSTRQNRSVPSFPRSSRTKTRKLLNCKLLRLNTANTTLRLAARLPDLGTRLRTPSSRRLSVIYQSPDDEYMLRSGSVTDVGCFQKRVYS